MKYKYKFCSTYEYISKGLSSVTSTRDLDKYQFDRSSSRCPLGDLNNYKSDTSISMCPMGDKCKYMYKLNTVYEEFE